MKDMYRKGQAATEFLMTYGWAILAIVIVAAVLWNMGIFKSQCTQTASVQVFPAGSQLAVKDWKVTANNSLEMVVQNLAGSDIIIDNSTSSFTVGGEIGGNITANVSISAGSDGTVIFPATPTITHKAGDCFTNGRPALTYYVAGGTSHSLVGTLQGKYE